MISMSNVSLGRRVVRKPVGVLLVILLLALALRLLFFVGMARTDDYNYAQAAYNLTTGVYRVAGPAAHHQARLAIVAPVAISFRLLGVNEHAAELWPLLCALGSIVVIFYLGKLLFDQTTGLFAALLLSFFPLEVVYSTQLLPDIIQPFFFALSVLCFLKGHETRNRRASCAWFCLSWLFVVAAFFTRETGVIILLFQVAYVLYNRSVKKEYLLAAAVVATFSLGIGLIYASIQGNPLAHIGVLLRITRFGTVEHLHGATRHFVKTWLEYPRMLTHDPQFVYFTIATTVAFVYLVRRKDKHLYVPVLWLLTLLLYMEFVAPLHYMLKLDRYLIVLTIPALLIVARFLAVLGTQRGPVVGLPIHGFPSRIGQGFRQGWLRNRTLYSSAIYWGFCAVAISLMLAGILFSPSFVRDYLSPDGILEANTVSMIQKMRLIACGLGAILTMALLVSSKWGWSHIFAIFAGIRAKLMAGFLIGFLFATSVSYIAVAAPHRRFYTFRFREAGHFLASLPEKDIYLPEGRGLWFQRLNFYLGFETGYNSFGTTEENEGSRLKPLPETGLEQIEDSYVITDQWFWEDDRWTIREEVSVPGWWEELMRINYVGGDTVIYYTGKQPSS